MADPLGVLVGHLDRFGYSWARTVRSAVGYLTGCRRRMPVVVVTEVLAWLGLSVLLSPLLARPWGWAGPFAAGFAWGVGYSGVTAPVARALDDALMGEALPAKYPAALTIARGGTATVAGGLMVYGVLIRSESVLVPMAGAALCVGLLTAAWAAVDLGDGGARTLAGDVRGLLTRRRLATVSGGS